MQAHMGRRNKSAKPLHADRKPTLDCFQNRDFQRLLLLDATVELLPGLFLIGLELRERVAVLAAFGYHIDVDNVADLDDVLRRIRLRISKLLFKNRNVLLGVDGYPSLAVGHRYDGGRHDRALLDILHVLQQGFHVLFVYI